MWFLHFDLTLYFGHLLKPVSVQRWLEENIDSTAKEKIMNILVTRKEIFRITSQLNGLWFIFNKRKIIWMKTFLNYQFFYLSCFFCRFLGYHFIKNDPLIMNFYNGYFACSRVQTWFFRFCLFIYVAKEMCK